MKKMIFRLLPVIIISTSRLPVSASGNEDKSESFFKRTGQFVMEQPQITSVLSKALKNFPENECTNRLKSFGEDLVAGKEWALKLLDATAKPQSGILLGNVMHIGNYDECLESKHKYCTAMVGFHPVYGKELSRKLKELLENFHLSTQQSLFEDPRKSYGFCVPKMCNATELQTIVNLVEDALALPVHLSFYEKACNTNDKVPFTTAAMIATAILTVFAVLVVVSTLYELLVRPYEKSPSLFTCFSMISNGRHIFAEISTEEISCLNGIRVISMMWVVLGHRYLFAFFSPAVNLIHILPWARRTENVFFIGATMSVDTFFTVSGLLLVYLYLKYREKGIEFSIYHFYKHRIIRLTPSLAMVILFSITLASYAGSGPFWPIVEKSFQDGCRRYWFSTLLYIQNYFNTYNQCLPQAWYLAADTQMYFLSPLILIPLSKWPKATITTVSGLIFTMVVCTFGITVYYRLPATFYRLDDRLFKYLYVPTHVRGASFLMGMLCGYYMFKAGNRSLKLRKWKVFFLWTTSMMVLLATVFGHLAFNNFTYSTLEAACFTSFSRVSWSLALSIIIVLCTNGYGGVVNSFLSNRVFTVLIRINYNIYLLHEWIMMFIMGQQRTPSYFSNLVVLHSFWGIYVFTVALAFLWTLTFESPMVALEKYFERRSRRS